MGAGSGRLAFLVLQALTDLKLGTEDFTYVVTDFNEDSLQALRDCPAFKPFIDTGVLKFERFDADNLDTFVQNDRGGRGTFAIANYLADTLRQDAFRIENNRLT